MVAGADGHLHADVIPPIEARPDRQHDSVLGRWLVGARGHEQSRTPHPIRVEFLDHDPIEKWFELISH